MLIKPNDQTYVGKKFCWQGDARYTTTLLGVGCENVIRTDLDTGKDLFDTIHLFNKYWTLLNDSVNWANVKYARRKSNGVFYKVEAIEYIDNSPHISVKNIRNGTLFWERASHFEPVKFTQTLKEGDYIRYVGEPGGAWVIEGSIIQIGDEGFRLRMNFGEDGYEEYKYHSDDWQLVNNKEKGMTANETIINELKQENKRLKAQNKDYYADIDYWKWQNDNKFKRNKELIEEIAILNSTIHSMQDTVIKLENLENSIAKLYNDAKLKS